MPEMTADECLIAISTLTGLDRTELNDFLSCDPKQQAALCRAYSDQHWITNKSTLGSVLSLLNVLSSFLGIISGAAGAAGAIAALKSL